MTRLDFGDPLGRIIGWLFLLVLTCFGLALYAWVVSGWAARDALEVQDLRTGDIDPAADDACC